MTPQEIYERHVIAGMTSNADAQANLYAEDGVYEAPLEPEDSTTPHRLEGHDALRAGFAAMHRLVKDDQRKIDVANSRSVLHTTANPDVFIVELDAAFENAAPVSLVQIYRVRDGKITLLRDYFAPSTLN
ncbi:nuclear transport factor 2 family protein [Umezawaea tangerina]|uniref:Ketosteroid isomerase-like protein n=1 Tax=Umezawaea tangerina TaxID=84725 RepID=A0A2T0SX10_9PSEU|nr:nuclear transport factor 2 family protein [Umezawaea tangerina]PRY37893.1 ketosteroid isomerase-like protein [Umezawaea tangerina]